MRPTLNLFLDLLGEVRELMRVELSLARAEVSERASGISIEPYGRCSRAGYPSRRSRSFIGGGQPVPHAVRSSSRPGVSHCRRGCDRAEPGPAARGRCGSETVTASPRQKHFADLVAAWRALAWA